MQAGSYGFPPALYPNITYFSEPLNATYNNSRAVYDGIVLLPGSGLLLGPWKVSPSFDLVSISMPINDNKDLPVVLGYLTVSRIMENRHVTPFHTALYSFNVHLQRTSNFCRN